MCIYDELCVKILFCHDEILHFKDRNLGQILRVDKTCFLRPSHIYIVDRGNFRIQAFIEGVLQTKFGTKGSGKGQFE